MNKASFIKCAVLAIPFILASCGSSKKVTETAPTAAQLDSIAAKQQLLQLLTENNQTTKFITSKVKFHVESGSQQITLTGNLKMKRDDVIRLQLMAFGFVEAGRLEFTEDYVLIMDRINKQFLKVSYDQVSFLRNSDINFYTLQSLFWNELFEPGKSDVTSEGFLNYTAEPEGSNLVVSYEKEKLSYKWLTDILTGRISMANILFKDKYRGNSQLNWDYSEFTKLGQGEFPTGHDITVTLPEKEVKLSILLNYLGDESDWETRTEVSSKYREVNIDEILRRFMSL